MCQYTLENKFSNFLFQAQEEFRTNCDSLSVQKLLETFIEVKSTGKEKPGQYMFGFICIENGPIFM